MQNERREHPPGRFFRRFFDLDLATKFSLMFSCMILAVLFLTALVMSRSGLRYVMEEQDARCLLSLDYVRILIEKDQSYVDGLTEYYISSAEAQELVNLSNAGQSVPSERMQELLISALFKMYLLSVVFYNLDGERYNIYSQVCEGTPFISCVIEPDSASFWSQTSIIRSAFLLICLFLIAMLPLTRVFVGMLTQPLAKLSESMVRFSRATTVRRPTSAARTTSAALDRCSTTWWRKTAALSSSTTSSSSVKRKLSSPCSRCRWTRIFSTTCCTPPIGAR